MPVCEHFKRSNRGSRATLIVLINRKNNFHQGAVTSQSSFNSPKSYTIPMAQLFQLCHHAISDTRYAWMIKNRDQRELNWHRLLTFCVQTIHHATDQLQLILETEIYKVGINKHTVRWNKSCVVCQKQRRSDLGTGRELIFIIGGKGWDWQSANSLCFLLFLLLLLF